MEPQFLEAAKRVPGGSDEAEVIGILWRFSAVVLDAAPGLLLLLALMMPGIMALLVPRLGFFPACAAL